MATTGARFLSVTNKRILGQSDFRDRILGYVKDAVADAMRAAFGIDGVFDGNPIVLTAFGAGRIQLSANYPLATDGNGNFLRTDAMISGRDVGLAFENTNTVVYDVGMHYAERPRGIQINPRTGFPEFLEMEETIGDQADPNLVTNNGSTLTFRVDSVAMPLGGTVRTAAGRRCLVWKKTPGRLATTENLAVELCTVAFTASHNVITTTTLLGQGVGQVSITPADYFVLMIGPMICRESDHDLRLASNYCFIGTVTGNAGTPTVFDIGDQHDLSSGFAAPLNAVTRVDSHGELKLRVGGDGSDANEPQIFIKNAGGSGAIIDPLVPADVGGGVFSVDEDGDTYIAGTLGVFGLSTLVSAAVQNAMAFGSVINAGSTAAAATSGRFNSGTLKPGTWNLIFNFATAGVPVQIYVHGDDGVGAMLTNNCHYTGTEFAKTTNGRAAYAICFGGVSPNAGVTLKIKAAALNANWADVAPAPTDDAKWNSKISLAGTTPGTTLADIPRILLGSALLSTAADALVARSTVVPNTQALVTWTLLHESKQAGTHGGARIYVGPEGEIALVNNASWDGTLWNKDLTSEKATKVQLDISGIHMHQKPNVDSTPWDETEWGLTAGGGLIFGAQASNEDPVITLNTKSLTVKAPSGINLTGPINVTGAARATTHEFSPAVRRRRFYGAKPENWHNPGSGMTLAQANATYASAGPTHLVASGTGGAYTLWNLGDLPDGVVIKKITFYSRSGATSNTLNAIAAAWRQAPFTNKEFFHTAVATTAIVLPDTNASYDALIDTAAGVAAVDNNAYTYWAQHVHGTGQAGAQFHGCLVEYEVVAIAG